MKKPIRFPNIFFMPTMGCVAKCRYCYSPVSSQRMSYETLDSTISWIKTSADSFTEEYFSELKEEKNQEIEITYHGGEALVMGKEFIRKSMELFDDIELPFPKQLSLQSNLWLLDEEYCHILKDHKVNVGTSLDGPEKINDNQRGAGYFKKTMQGIDLLRKHDIPVACICTFTKDNAPYYEEIYNFFAQEKLNFTFFMVHPTMDKEFDYQLLLTCQEQVELVDNLTQIYLSNPDQISIQALDSHLLSLTTRFPGAYVLGNCIGSQIAIGPDGGIYNCQMFVGHDKYRWGSVTDTHSLSDIKKSHSYQEFEKWQANQKHNCKGCYYFDICSGGCIYNAIMSNEGLLDVNKKDPNCQGYQESLNAVNILQKQAMSLSSSGINHYPPKQLEVIGSFRGLLKTFWEKHSS